MYLQQDNAGPHALFGDATVEAAGREGGWKIRLVCQPPNSPDLNVLDLGFFNSIQSLQYQEETFTTDDLIAAVHRAFRNTLPDTIDRCFVTLQGVMIKVIEHHGHNDYKLPRISPYRRGNARPLSLTCDGGVVDSGIVALVAYVLSFC